MTTFSDVEIQLDLDTRRFEQELNEFTHAIELSQSISHGICSTIVAFGKAAVMLAEFIGYEAMCHPSRYLFTAAVEEQPIPVELPGYRVQLPVEESEIRQD